MVAKSLTKALRLASAAVVGLSFVAIYVFNIGQVGDSMQFKDGQAKVSAGTHPIVLVWDFIAILMFVALMRGKSPATAEAVPTRWRRILAFFIDFWFSLLIVSGIGAMVPLWLEAARTGRFAWHFERNYTVSTDGSFAFPLSLVFMALMFLYFVFPLTRGKQTVGCFIVRIRVAPPFGDRGRFTLREAIKRTYSEFSGIGAFLTRRWDKDGRGRTWYDVKTNCTVVLVEDD